MATPEYRDFKGDSEINITLDNASTCVNPGRPESPGSYANISGTYQVKSMCVQNGRTYVKVTQRETEGNSTTITPLWVDVTDVPISSYDNYANYLGWMGSDEAVKAYQAGVQDRYDADEAAKMNDIHDELVYAGAGELSGGGSVGYVQNDGDYQLITLMDNKNVDVLNAYGSKLVKIFGLPPQWTAFVDPRVNNESEGSDTILIGRRYAETIMGAPTILALCPGKLEYSGGLKDLVAGVMSAADFKAAMNKGALEPFWKFVDTWHSTTGETGYINYVNVMCRYAAICLTVSNKDRNIGGEFDLANEPTAWSGGQTYSTMDIMPLLSAEIFHGGAINAASTLGKQYVYFNANGNVTTGDEFNTETRASTLEQTINGFSSNAMKDLAFMITGQVSGNDGMIESDLESLDDIAISTFGGGIGALITSFKEIIHGGIIAFPQVIDNVTWGKSFTFNVRFTSIYGDVESRFLHVIMPYIALMALFLPRQLKNAIDMYAYPPVVRAFARGLYACQCGVLTGINVKFGGDEDNAWTASGQPTEIQVSFSIKSLHQNLMQSDSEIWIAKNLGLQLYIGTMCGIDMTLTNTELMELTLNSFKNKILYDTISNVQYTVWNFINKTSINGILSNIFNW